MAIAASTRRVPGLRFETLSPALDEVLPRMDIAIFVGFAARGPLHIPVVVEDAAQFASIFGGDVTLAWDRARSEPVFAYLAPAVGAFFRNGGRRCWVVRVAGQARPNVFPIPGLARVGARGLVPAFAQARSAGSWSDALRVGATLLTQPLAAAALSPAQPALYLTTRGLDDLEPGDLVRVTFRASGHVLFFVVDSVTAGTSGSPPWTGVTVTGTNPTWFSVFAPAAASATGATAQLTLEYASLPADLFPASSPTPGPGAPPLAVLGASWPRQGGPGGPTTIDLPLGLAEAPPPGALVRVDTGQAQLGLVVQDIIALQPDVRGPAIRVAGQGLWWLRQAPDPAPSLQPSDTVERLTFELAAWRGALDVSRVGELGFAPRHHRFWADLPTDDAHYRGASVSAKPWTPDDLAVPLAGSGPSDAVYLPLAVAAFEDFQPAVGPVRGGGTPLERDGLATFGPELFLDSALADSGVLALRGEADFIRYQSPQPRDLVGVHAALDVAEATLIAVPDAVHRGWSRGSPAPPTPPVPSAPPAEPEWSRFLPRGTRLLAPPALTAQLPDESGTFTLGWSSVANGTYELEESDRPDFVASSVVYSGSDTRIQLYGRAPGDYYYRVRAVVPGSSTSWSNGVVVRVGPSQMWLLARPEDYSDTTLLLVQRATLRLCAARGDLFALLALPEHYRDSAATQHAVLLGSAAGSAQHGNADAPTASYGALYFPWLISQDENGTRQLRRTPADGAVGGAFARLALTRGAWISPANTPITGPVGVEPFVPRERRLALLDSRVNLVHQDPRGSVTLSADTLSTDPSVRPVHVRRLLILLRRLAQRDGAAFVFEPNSDAFRRSVQHGYEALLDELFARGAFAGASSREAYQVVTSGAADGAPLFDGGRLVVELRVAPAQPMSFLTVRLVQTGNGTLVTEGR